MTKEQLTMAYEANKEINELEAFIKAFDSPYQNVIRANDYDGDVDKTKILNLSCHPRLEEIIRQEIKKTVQELQKQFEEL